MHLDITFINSGSSHSCYMNCSLSEPLVSDSLILNDAEPSQSYVCAATENYCSLSFYQNNNNGNIVISSIYNVRSLYNSHRKLYVKFR